MNFADATCNFRRLIALLILSGLLGASVTTRAEQPESETPVKFTDREKEVVRLSGMVSLAEQIRSYALRIMDDKFSFSQKYAVAQALSTEWAPEKLNHRLLLLADTLSSGEQNQVLSGLRNKQIRQALQKEQDAISLQHGAVYTNYTKKLIERPPGPGRAQLMEALDDGSGFSELIIRARQIVHKEIRHYNPEWEPEKDWKKKTKRDVMDFLYYTYRTTPNPELQNYISAFRNPGVQRWLRDVKRSFSGVSG